MIKLVGSRALEYFGISMNREGIQDWDFIGTEEEVSMILNLRFRHFDRTEVKETKSGYLMKAYHYGNTYYVEFHVINSSKFEDKYGDKELYNLRGYSITELVSVGPMMFIAEIAEPELILMMKLSHKFKDDVHFVKTRNDILKLQSRGYSLNSELEELLKDRTKRTIRPAVKLSTSKKEFFTDNVKYLYDHDTLHEAVKIGDKPAYTYFQKDGSEVECDMDKFFRVSEDIRMNALCEETAVLALERAVIPFNTDYKRAYQRALRGVCTTITSGRFREYAWQNYDKALESVWDFTKDFKRGVESGIVKLHRS